MAQWKRDRHGTETLDLGHGLRASVYYEGIERLGVDEPKYNVMVFGARLAKRTASLDEGKKIAERAATRWLRDAIGQLPHIGN